MNTKHLKLQDDYSDLSVEAGSDQIEITIEFGDRNLSFEASKEDAEKLRDFINEFLEDGEKRDKMQNESEVTVK